MILACSLVLAISGPASPAPSVVLRPAPKPRASSTTSGQATPYVPHSDLRDPFGRRGSGVRAGAEVATTKGLKDPFVAPVPRRKRAQAQHASSTLQPAPRRALVDPFAVTPSGRPAPARLSEELKDPFAGEPPRGRAKNPSGTGTSPEQPAKAAVCPSGRPATATGCTPASAPASAPAAAPGTGRSAAPAEPQPS